VGSIPEQSKKLYAQMIALKFVTSASAGCRRHFGIFLKPALAAKAAACPPGVVAAAIVRFQSARHNVAAPQCGRHTASHVACPQDRQIGSVGSIPEQSKKLYAKMIALKFVTSASAGCRRHPGIFLKPARAAKAAACPAVAVAGKVVCSSGPDLAGRAIMWPRQYVAAPVCGRASMWPRHYVSKVIKPCHILCTLVQRTLHSSASA